MVVVNFAISFAKPMDKYEDSLEKYSRWMEKYGNGGERSQRQTDLTNLIFVPHRPSSEGRVIPGRQDFAPASLRELEDELLPPNNVRNVRNNLVLPTTSSVYDFSVKGLLPHQQRKSFPYYGRRRRSPGTGARPEVTSGWTILDPVTGREIQESIGTDVNLRHVRKPSQLSNLESDVSYTSFKDENGQRQPIYKYFKKYPHGYSG